MRTHTKHTHTHHPHLWHVHWLYPSTASRDNTHSTYWGLRTMINKHTGLCQFHLHSFQAIKQDRKLLHIYKVEVKMTQLLVWRGRHTMWLFRRPQTLPKVRMAALWHYACMCKLSRSFWTFVTCWHTQFLTQFLFNLCTNHTISCLEVNDWSSPLLLKTPEGQEIKSSLHICPNIELFQLTRLACSV